MKNDILMSRWLAAVSAVICLVSFLATPRPGFCDSQLDDEEVSQQQNTPDVEELRLREDEAVKEVNEATLAEIAQAEAVRRSRYQEELGYVPTGKLLSGEELAAIEKQRKEKEKTIRAKVGYEIQTIKTDEQGEQQGRTEGAGQRPVARPRKDASKPVRGLVTGIVFCDNRGAALIDGDVVRENDTVLGAKVVKILHAYVEFEKDGKHWKQMVGQTPAVSVWE